MTAALSPEEMTTSLAVPAMAHPAVSREPLLRTHIPSLDHAQKFAALQGNLAMHAAGNIAATAAVFAHGIDLQTFEELLELQQATWQRLRGLQKQWTKSWLDWMHYADQIKGANTMSKLAEREGNILVQLVLMLSSQVIDLASLQENMEVSYRYWISEKLEQQRAA